MSDPDNNNPPRENADFDTDFEEILDGLKNKQYAAYLEENTAQEEGQEPDAEDEEPQKAAEQQEAAATLAPAPVRRHGRLHVWFTGLPKSKKITLSVAAGLLALILALGAAGFIYIHVKLGKLGGGSSLTDDLNFDDEIYEESDFSTIDADLNASSFKEGIRQWATNGGAIMSSRNVINVLIIGYDSRKNEFTGNTDAIMLLSLNKKTKMLTMSSFLRDQYMYYETADGNTGFNKINAICSAGGPGCLLNAIENHYKIKVDKYVAVNFASFKKLIDKMGGIDVTVQKYESDYYYEYFKKSIPYGENVHLDGTQALGFCRIRKCDADGDVSRTRRQQMVIEAIIGKVSDASLFDVNKYIDAVLPYVTTNFSNNDIISLGARAMTGKWFNYEKQQMRLPTDESRYGYSGSTWIWVVDYPLSAQALQSAVFGMTNIALNEGRTTIIDLIRGTTGSGGASAHEKPSATNGGTETSEKTTVSPTAAPTAEKTTQESAAPTDTTAAPTTVPTAAPTDTTAAPTTEPTSPETSATGD